MNVNKIKLKHILSEVFVEEPPKESQIWLQEIDFQRGESYLIRANSGAGKSSLCSFLYGSRKDYSGNIFFDGENIQHFSNIKWDTIRQTQLSLQFQELGLFPDLTALENVQLKNNLTGYKSESEINHFFQRLDIAFRRDTKVRKMSWGQQQRVALIRCLCQPFSFLVLDEPISHLDDRNAAIMAALIEEEVSAQGAGLIITSIGKHMEFEGVTTILL